MMGHEKLAYLSQYSPRFGLIGGRVARAQPRYLA
jgi:hypothetical protein